MLEKQVEGPVVAWARKFMMVSKMNGVGCRSWPDRCFWIPHGAPFFIEFKRPGGEATPAQLLLHEQLRKAGYEVEIHDNKQSAINAIKQRMEAAQVSAERH